MSMQVVIDLRPFPKATSERDAASLERVAAEQKHEREIVLRWQNAVFSNEVARICLKTRKTK